MHPVKAARLLLALVAASLILAACSGSEDAPKTTATAATPGEKPTRSER